MNEQRAKTGSREQGEAEIIALASALVKCPSITPIDAGAQVILMRRLEALGFRITPIVDGDSRAFWAERLAGDSDAPLFAFSGHTDVVPPGDLSQWKSDPFSPVERGISLWKRHGGYEE